MRGVGSMALAILAAGSTRCTSAREAASGSAGPAFTAANELIYPAGYREWIYLSSGMGMTYRKPDEAPAGEPGFDNVFVDPEAYRTFARTGHWPEPAIFVVEVRESRTHGSINLGGRFQGSLRAVEAEVKDRTRFPGGWAFFSFEPAEGPPAPARALPLSSACYDCHRLHGAVEQTFVQFYPTLLEIATRLGTLNPGFRRDAFDEGGSHL